MTSAGFRYPATTFCVICLSGESSRILVRCLLLCALCRPGEIGLIVGFVSFGVKETQLDFSRILLFGVR